MVEKQIPMPIRHRIPLVICSCWSGSARFICGADVTLAEPPSSGAVLDQLRETLGAGSTFFAVVSAAGLNGHGRIH
jgi:hypothetical protein